MAELPWIRLARARQAWREARAAVAQQSALPGLRLGRPLQVKSGRAVFAARLNGRTVVVKLIRDPERRGDVVAAEAELRRAWTTMADGPHRVPEPLFADAATGLLVMARAEGKRLTDVLRRASPDRGAALLRHSADWLETFTAARQRRRDFAAEFWVGQHAARVDAMPDADARQLARHVLIALKVQAARLHHRPVTQVRPHGDFWSHNLMWDGAVMTGIDLQHSSWQPLAKDPARLLTHVSLILPVDGGPWRYGLPERWVAPVEGGGLLREEPAGLLRFFIGLEMGHRLISEARFPKTRRETRAILDRYLSSPG